MSDSDIISADFRRYSRTATNENELLRTNPKHCVFIKMWDSDNNYYLNDFSRLRFYMNDIECAELTTHDRRLSFRIPKCSN